MSRGRLSVAPQSQPEASSADWTCPRCGYLCSHDTCPECGLRAASIAETVEGAAIRYILAAQLHALGAREHLRARAEAGGAMALAGVLAFEIAVGAWLCFCSFNAAELIRDAGMFGPTNDAEVWSAVVVSAVGFFGLAVAMPLLWLTLVLPLLAVALLMSRPAPAPALRLLLLAPLAPVVAGGVGMALMLAQFSKPVRGEMIMRGVEFHSLAGEVAVMALSLAAGQVVLAAVICGLTRLRPRGGLRWQLAWQDAVIAGAVIAIAVGLVLRAAAVGRS